MKGRYTGIWTPDQLFQTVGQDWAYFFPRKRITHIKSVFFYFTPCDPTGKEVIILDELGDVVLGYDTAGYYPSAADQYEKPVRLEPTKFVRIPP
jgi:hypothetical protein